MSETTIGYVVVEYNQASGFPDLIPMHPQIHRDPAAARAELAYARAVTARVGRREKHVIARLVPIDED